MNYDTLVEQRVLKNHDHLNNSFFPDRILNAVRTVPLATTGADLVAGSTSEATTFEMPWKVLRLAKLHGSIDWQYPGNTDRGLPVYAVGIDGLSHRAHEMPQMTPYIIPPCFTKGPMFDHEVIRGNWHSARDGLERAEELVVMGYSLPPADTTVVQMLGDYAPDKITLLDTNKTLKQQYEELLGATVETIDSDNPIWDWTSNITSQT